ncbi:TetR/AcrR family transcriptional regulator [Rhodococcus pyridinivorans]|uniref:TetR/AcrR family transcriptional regulator n=1 Tax=Rhodococcus pyridinivorans TaxID=103816 RepID=UPI000B2829BD|nr:TetR/AcrR family transcriptional regulator [Rhodococcus pyridinivorans]
MTTSTPPPGPLQKSWETSRAAKRIMSAAVEVFSERGFGGTSTRDIARRLEMSSAAMYPHFDSKEDLLFAIAIDGHRRALETLQDAARAPAPTHSAKLATTVEAFANWEVDNRALARVVQYEIRALAPEHYRDVIELRRSTSNLIESIIVDGHRDGEFRCASIPDVTLAINSLCVDICRWFPSAQHRDGAALARSYARMAVAMARTDELT